jgi:hypothetical protein
MIIFTPTLVLIVEEELGAVSPSSGQVWLVPQIHKCIITTSGLQARVFALSKEDLLFQEL